MSCRIQRQLKWNILIVVVFTMACMYPTFGVNAVIVGKCANYTAASCLWQPTQIDVGYEGYGAGDGHYKQPEMIALESQLAVFESATNQTVIVTPLNADPYLRLHHGELMSTGAAPDLLMMMNPALLGDAAMDLTKFGLSRNWTTRITPALLKKAGGYGLPDRYSMFAIWIDATLFAYYNLKIPTTFAELVQLGVQLQTLGINPFGIGTKEASWTVLAWLSIIARRLGGQKWWLQLLAGTIDLRTDPVHLEAWRLFGQLLPFFPQPLNSTSSLTYLEYMKLWARGGDSTGPGALATRPWAAMVYAGGSAVLAPLLVGRPSANFTWFAFPQITLESSPLALPEKETSEFATIGYWVMGKYSKNPAAAYQLLDVFSSQAYAAAFIGQVAGFVPALQEAQPLLTNPHLIRVAAYMNAPDRLIFEGIDAASPTFGVALRGFTTRVFTEGLGIPDCIELMDNARKEILRVEVVNPTITVSPPPPASPEWLYFASVTPNSTILYSIKDVTYGGGVDAAADEWLTAVEGQPVRLNPYGTQRVRVKAERRLFVTSGTIQETYIKGHATTLFVGDILESTFDGNGYGFAASLLLAPLFSLFVLLVTDNAMRQFKIERLRRRWTLVGGAAYGIAVWSVQVLGASSQRVPVGDAFGISLRFDLAYILPFLVVLVGVAQTAMWVALRGFVLIMTHAATLPTSRAGTYSIIGKNETTAAESHIQRVEESLQRDFLPDTNVTATIITTNNNNNNNNNTTLDTASLLDPSVSARNNDDTKKKQRPSESVTAGSGGGWRKMVREGCHEHYPGFDHVALASFLLSLALVVHGLMVVLSQQLVAEKEWEWGWMFAALIVSWPATWLMLLVWPPRKAVKPMARYGMFAILGSVALLSATYLPLFGVKWRVTASTVVAAAAAAATKTTTTTSIAANEATVVTSYWLQICGVPGVILVLMGSMIVFPFVMGLSIAHFEALHRKFSDLIDNLYRKWRHEFAHRVARESADSVSRCVDYSSSNDVLVLKHSSMTPVRLHLEQVPDFNPNDATPDLQWFERVPNAYALYVRECRHSLNSDSLNFLAHTSALRAMPYCNVFSPSTLHSPSSSLPLSSSSAAHMPPLSSSSATLENTHNNVNSTTTVSPHVRKPTSIAPGGSSLSQSPVGRPNTESKSHLKRKVGANSDGGGTTSEMDEVEEADESDPTITATGNNTNNNNNNSVQNIRHRRTRRREHRLDYASELCTHFVVGYSSGNSSNGGGVGGGTSTNSSMLSLASDGSEVMNLQGDQKEAIVKGVLKATTMFQQQLWSPDESARLTALFEPSVIVVRNLISTNVLKTWRKQRPKTFALACRHIYVYRFTHAQAIQAADAEMQVANHNNNNNNDAGSSAGTESRGGNGNSDMKSGEGSRGGGGLSDHKDAIPRSPKTTSLATATQTATTQNNNGEQRLHIQVQQSVEVVLPNVPTSPVRAWSTTPTTTTTTH